MTRRFFLLVMLVLILAACSPTATTAPTVAPTAAATDIVIPTDTVVAPTDTPTVVADTPTVAATDTLQPSTTPTSATSATPTLAPTAEKTETIGEKLKSHIVFYLVLPEKDRRDACGTITVQPIISKRLVTGDKLNDVQIALNMLFSVGSKFYGVYYNALWDTHFDIESTQYDPRKDYMTITFGGDFPYTRLTDCDKHGIREQIWTTFFHYGFHEKTFKYYDHYMIDRLGGN